MKKASITVVLFSEKEFAVGHTTLDDYNIVSKLVHNGPAKISVLISTWAKAGPRKIILLQQYSPLALYALCLLRAFSTRVGHDLILIIKNYKN